jgi:hypothetical protein
MSESKDVASPELPLCMAGAEEAVITKATKLNETAEIIDSMLLYGSKQTSSDVLMISISDDTEPSDYIVVAEHDAGKCNLKYTAMIASGLLPQAEETTESCKKVAQDHVLKTLQQSEAQVTGIKVLYGDKNSYGNALLIRTSDQSGRTDHAVITKSKGASCEIAFAAQVAKGKVPDVEGLK